jgi:hypothetical protein
LSYALARSFALFLHTTSQRNDALLSLASLTVPSIAYLEVIRLPHNAIVDRSVAWADCCTCLCVPLRCQVANCSQLQTLGMPELLTMTPTDDLALVTLSVSDCPRLASLGLPKLTTAGTILVARCAAFASFAAPVLKVVNRELTVEGNPALTTMQVGASPLSPDVQLLVLPGDAWRSSCSPGRCLICSVSLFDSVSIAQGLPVLSKVGTLNVRGNAALVSMAGLEALRTIDQGLD